MTCSVKRAKPARRPSVLDMHWGPNAQNICSVNQCLRGGLVSSTPSWFDNAREEAWYPRRGFAVRDVTERAFDETAMPARRLSVLDDAFIPGSSQSLRGGLNSSTAENAQNI